MFAHPDGGGDQTMRSLNLSTPSIYPGPPHQRADPSPRLALRPIPKIKVGEKGRKAWDKAKINSENN